MKDKIIKKGNVGSNSSPKSFDPKPCNIPNKITDQFKKKIEKIYKNYEELKAEDYDIKLEDSNAAITRKDIIYGQLIAYEEIIKIIQED